MTVTPARALRHLPLLLVLGVLAALTVPAAAFAGAATVTPSSHDFGPVPYRTYDATYTFTVTNTGATPLTVTSASFGGVPFGGSWTNCAINPTLAPGASCTFFIQFAPFAASRTFPGGGPGPKSATATIFWSDETGAHTSTAALSGIAVDPAAPVLISPAAYGFGPVEFDRRADHTFTATNTSGAPVALSGVLVRGNGFGLLADGISDRCSYQTLAAGASCTFTASFGAVSVDGTGPRTGTVTLAESSSIVALSATAVVRPARISVSPSSHDFGRVAPGERSAPVTLTVSNTGGQSMTVTPGALGSTDADQFAIESDGCANQTVAAGAACTVTVRFAPTTDGAKHAALAVGSPDADNGNAGAGLSGSGQASPAAPAVTGGPQGTTTDTTARFEFSGEPGATFTCSLDGGPFAPCASPATYAGLAAGRHTFGVRQTDAAGHVGATSTQTFTVASGSQAGNDGHPPQSGPNPPDATRLSVVVASTGTVSHAGVPVGCRLNAGRLKACTVLAYAGGRRVGHGTATFTSGRRGTVVVKLTARGRRLVHRLHGVRLTYRETATTATGRRLTGRGSSRVLPLTVAAVPTDGLFASGLNRLNRSGRAYVRSLAGQLDDAKRVVCTGHTDSAGPASYNLRLGLERAETVCTTLRHYGAHARLLVRSQGERHPRAGNGTASGRALNRRVELAVTYR
jgi:outer membrane protein OmpA-like peptidoglycan-associated protein